MITSLDLKDFKCFKSFDKPINFSQINLLTGCNGRGKSSIFQSLLLLAQSFRNEKEIISLCLNGKFVNLGSFSDVISRQSDTKKMSIMFTSDDNDENTISFVFRSNDNNPRTACLSSLKVKYGDIEKEMVSSVGGNDNSQSETTVTGSTSDIKAINQLRNVFFISADRQGPKNYVNRVDEHDNNVGIHGEYVIHTLQEKEKSLMTKVIESISTIMGGASIEVKDVDTEYIKVLIDSADNQEGYKPVNVGFGYSYILPVVVLPLIIPEGSKLFIENPEAHLHPGAQSRMMDFLIRIAKERNIQLFIETHSDHVINAVRIAIKHKQFDVNKNDIKLIHLERESNAKQPLVWQINVDAEGNLSDYPNEFMDEWTKQMLDLV